MTILRTLRATIRAAFALPILFSQACGGGGSGGDGPPTPTAAASQLAIRVNPAGTRTGATLSTQPVIEVQDASGKLFTSGSVPVTVAIASGGGTLGGTTTVSSVSGVATFTDLSISGAGGGRTLSFSAPGLTPAQSASFTLTSPVIAKVKFVTAPPTQMQVTVPANVVVQLIDDTGAPFTAPTTVTASVLSGSARAIAGATATSGSDGTATFNNLTLGALNGLIGAITLRFSAGSNVFADTTSQLGCYFQPLTLSQAATGTLSANDCWFGNTGTPVRFYSTTLSTASAVQVTQTGSMVSRPGMLRPGDASNWSIPGTTSGAAVTFKGILPAGEFWTSASGATSSDVGQYTLLVTPAPNMDVDCEDIFMWGPLTTSQQLKAGDCLFTGTQTYYDDVLVGLGPGSTLTATASSAAFRPLASVYLDTGYVATGTSGSSSTVTYRNPATTPVIVDLIVDAASNTLVTGAYTLSLSVTNPPSSAAAAERRFSIRASRARGALRPLRSAPPPPTPARDD